MLSSAEPMLLPGERGQRAEPFLAVLRTAESTTGDASSLAPSTLYARFGKRAVDIFAGVVFGLLAVPLMMAVALSVRMSMGAGVIYKQRRVGRGGKAFTMLKFRTMSADRRKASLPFDGEDRRVCHKRDDDPRHTSVGRFLRRASLDELPQIWNVLKGDMSLVGPRPELVDIVDRYAPWQHDRHQVKPGLTGFWQISERAGGLAHEGVEYDIDYLRRLSFTTDCTVLLRTVPVTLRRTGR
jgi:lipopolysaccharide/colanic/teichoic acid biosynthesis glycosyltransferase